MRGRPEWHTGAVSSVDGTTIGYRQIGEGPGMVLLHGGMMASQNFQEIGHSPIGPVHGYVPDRRGRA